MILWSRWLHPFRSFHVLVSVGGLAPAMALLMLCAAYLGHEFSFDPFVRDPEQVVAVTAVVGGPTYHPLPCRTRLHC